VGPEALRILIVDDHEDSAEMLSMLLSGKGHTTRMALDGATALAVAAAFRPNVGLLDLSLPGMSGYELAERLRAIPGLTHIRLVAVTGHGSDAHRVKARAAGFDEHLLKPVDLQVVDAVLASVSQRLRQAR
jgi:CheY-like chemotaxis protein